MQRSFFQQFRFSDIFEIEFEISQELRKQVSFIVFTNDHQVQPQMVKNQFQLD